MQLPKSITESPLFLAALLDAPAKEDGEIWAVRARGVEGQNILISFINTHIPRYKQFEINDNTKIVKDCFEQYEREGFEKILLSLRSPVPPYNN